MQLTVYSPGQEMFWWLMANHGGKVALGLSIFVCVGLYISIKEHNKKWK